MATGSLVLASIPVTGIGIATAGVAYGIYKFCKNKKKRSKK